MKPGSIFTPRDSAAAGSRTAVATALSRQLKAGAVRQPARGLYQIPETHPLLGEMRATPDQIATALAGKHQLKLQPSGAYAASPLGLSDQLPQRIVYLTDGTPRQVRIGKQQIVLRRTTPRNMATAGRVSGLVIQALRHVGQRSVDRALVEKLRKRFGPRERAQLLKDVPLAPVWIGELMREIASGARRLVDRFLRLSPEDRARAFEQSAVSRGLSPASVEVDYDTLRRGTIQMPPLREQLEEWRRDYAAMQGEMFRGPRQRLTAFS